MVLCELPLLGMSREMLGLPRIRLAYIPFLVFLVPVNSVGRDFCDVREREGYVCSAVAWRGMIGKVRGLVLGERSQRAAYA